MSDTNYLRKLKYYLTATLYKTNKLWPDRFYLKCIFKNRMGYSLNLDNPKTFNEKLQWLKIHDRNPMYTTMVDKIGAKDYVQNIIGADYIIPTIGIYKSVNEIDWENLPNQFVLKCAHDSGGIVICKDKNKLTNVEILKAKKKLNKALKCSYYSAKREYPYKDVPHRILCEKYIANGDDLKDYKFFCFNGEPKFLKVDFGRFTEHHANYYDLDWNLLPFGEEEYPPVLQHVEERPPHFNKMIEIVRKLSKGLKFVRIDLYNINGNIYFGEITFYPASGLGRLTSKEWEYKLGEWIKI